jgi:hypothetical protein
MAISFRNRLAFRLALLREHAREYAVGMLILARIIGIFLFNYLYFASPVVKHDRLQGTISAIAMIPQKSYGEPGASSRYQYIVSLGENATVVVADQISRPHPVGSVVEIERRTRANGVLTNHVVSPDCAAPDCVVIPFNQQF